jgi:hypothetical protein
MSNERVERVRPPQPPAIDRRIRLGWPQLVGFPILFLLPLLAITGLLGERWRTIGIETGELEARIEYPDRFRSRLDRPMTVRIRNRSGSVMDSLDVAFDPAYLERFAAVAFIPEPRAGYVVSLAGIRPDETRLVRIELEGGIVGRHRGRIVFRSPRDSAAVVIQTTVLP